MDSSVGGLGGCPYAKGATGNVATEDVLFMCELLGVDHGFNFPKIIETGSWITSQLNRCNNAHVTIEDLGKIDYYRSLLFDGKNSLQSTPTYKVVELPKAKL